MRRRSLLLLLVLALLAPAVYVTAARVSASREPLTVTYCRPGGRPLKMDLYLPASRGAAPVPLVLYVHGGAWVSGSRADGGDLFPQLLPKLRSAGLAAAAIDYRLAGQAPWPAPLQDTECALAYLRAHSAQLGIDSHRIRLYGTSAGGQIVSMAALERAPGVDRVVDMYGPADLVASDWSAWLETDIRREFGSQALTASPDYAIRGAVPDILVVQGECDKIVPPAQSREFVARLQAAGDTVRYFEVRGAGHGLWGCHGARPDPAVQQQVAGLVATYLTE